ncbi:putative flavin-binding monooxygenase [Microthyrium microscopicum]|uniref:Putative flavin-binding monooxygenase n=1 Tax=Microthyrium microscopicum TaxID=703497 RepID=A0A6A6UN47_9PEZI|nr:putative flavin-binding monooxygenase [Microthyrium microscopicum]
MAVQTEPTTNGDVVVVGKKGEIGITLEETKDESELQPGNENTEITIVEKPAYEIDGDGNIRQEALAPKSKEADIEELDVIIVGAGISGINMGYRTQTMLKNKSFTILERRGRIGGTWDLMKYPGIRSDSDLYTFGFAWRPWKYAQPIAKGELIQQYMIECAQETGLDSHIRFHHRLVSAAWRSREQRWTLTTEITAPNTAAITKTFRTQFLVLGTGYYDHDKPLATVIPGLESFKGIIAHPQFWPQDLNYANKNIAVIGSGATAVTLTPALAETAAHVTMVQRSPSYIVSLPNRGTAKPWWIRIWPIEWQRQIVRWRYLFMGFVYRRFLSKDSDTTKKFLARITQAQLPEHIPYDPHFKPKYAPWAQRMCLTPNGDFFKGLRDKKVSMCTGAIESVVEDGIVMQDGTKIDADIIVTATGLHMKYGGNCHFDIDGEEFRFGEKYLWRGIMVQDMPNAALVLGYTKASWTLGADATASLVVRMIKHLDRNGLDSATPRMAKKDVVRITSAPGVMGLTSTYILRALHRLPKTSDQKPWKARGNYLEDNWDAQYGSLTTGMQFTKSVT